MTDEDIDAGTETDERVGGLSRRTLIRLLVGLGIGIPILVEALTFLGLVGEQLGDDGDGGGTATVSEDRVAVGDELLPATDQRETLASAVLRESGETEWDLSLTVDVENTGDTDYEFQLLTMHLQDGTPVSGRATTDRIEPGASAAVTGEWAIPAGSTPVAVDVVALIYPDGEGTVETREARAELAKIPVRGG